MNWHHPSWFPKSLLKPSSPHCSTLTFSPKFHKAIILSLSQLQKDTTKPFDYQTCFTTLNDRENFRRITQFLGGRTQRCLTVWSEVSTMVRLLSFYIICFRYLQSKHTHTHMNSYIIFFLRSRYIERWTQTKMCLYAAGDHVKFGFPFGAAMTMLLWGVVRFRDGYVYAGQLDDVYNITKWGLDYMVNSWDPFREELVIQVTQELVSDVL